MIKYLELTAPEESRFRQAKILSIKIKEGDQVKAGDTLFRVQSGDSELDLPSRLTGKIIEIIVAEGENISLITPLVLLETEVEKSTATKPISSDSEPSSDVSVTPSENSDKSSPKKPKESKKKKKKKKKHLEQQSLNLGEETDSEPDENKPEEPANQTIERETKPSTANDTSKQDSTSKMETSSMSNENVRVPDIGIESAKVIEILVAVGDSVQVDDSLVTLESDKASMDVPSTAAGIIDSIAVSLEQDVSEGDILITLSLDTKVSSDSDSEIGSSASETEASSPPDATPPSSSTEPKDIIIDLIVPDIGGDSAKVIEILATDGQDVALDDPLITLESDKASMDVPSTADGTIVSIELEQDQEVSEGTLIAKLRTTTAPDPGQTTAQAPATSVTATSDPAPAKPSSHHIASTTPPSAPSSHAHASPSVRRLARELGADLGKVPGSGRKGRITKDDVKQFVKGVMTGGAPGPSAEHGAGIPAVPAIDFSKFGEIETQPLNKIKRLTAANLHRSWLNVPHVTHNDESNISDLEAFRKQLNEEYKKQDKGIKLSPLAFIVKAVVNALQTFPQFNASLEPGGENLIYKKYFHIGIAVDTPNGLVVPVVRDADTKSVADIALEMGELAKKARDKKLTPADMSGACFTISSLGGIGGTSFTPIVNAPEVAILGVSRSKMAPVWNGEDFTPGMMLPLSLSYDHRVIDGAEAARFTRHIAAVLEDVRRLAV